MKMQLINKDCLLRKLKNTFQSIVEQVNEDVISRKLLLTSHL